MLQTTLRQQKLCSHMLLYVGASIRYRILCASSFEEAKFYLCLRARVHHDYGFGGGKQEPSALVRSYVEKLEDIIE